MYAIKSYIKAGADKAKLRNPLPYHTLLVCSPLHSLGSKTWPEVAEVLYIVFISPT